MPVIDQVKKLLDLGLSPFPIIKNSKFPAIPWKSYQERFVSLAEAKILFKEGMNIGIATGKLSRVIVLDLDSYKKETGITLTSPVSVITPRGGEHLYLKYQPLLNTVNQSLASDMRGDGGFVMVPDSVIDGKMYRWKIEPTREMFENLPELPKDILEKIYQQNADKETFQKFDRFDTSTALNISEGGRNDALHKLALSLLARGHSENEAWDLVVIANKTYQPPLLDNEVITLFKSAVKRNKVSPAFVSARKTEVSVENEDFKLQTFDQMIAGAEAYILEGKKLGIRSGFPALDEIIGGFQLGQSYLVYADTNSGKSIFQLNILIFMARNGEKVMYFDLENSFASMTAERMVLVNEGGNLTKTEWNLLSKEEKLPYVRKLAAMPFMMWDQAQLGDRFSAVTWESIEQCILEGIKMGVRVFAIDHLHYFEPSRTDFSELANVAKRINDLAARHNVVIIAVAHTKKGLIKQKHGKIEALRPTIGDVAGSGMLTKHTKNVIGLQRNYQAFDVRDQKKLMVYVDKTKNGSGGYIKMEFNPQTLVISDFRTYPTEVVPVPQLVVKEASLPEVKGSESETFKIGPPITEAEVLSYFPSDDCKKCGGPLERIKDRVWAEAHSRDWYCINPKCLLFYRPLKIKKPRTKKVKV